MRLKIIFVLILILLFTAYPSAHAGGPLVVKGGMAITYGTRPFLYRFDKGPCGMFSNTEITELTASLFMDWEIPTTELKFQQDTPGTLDIDVDASNFDPILNSPKLLGYTPVIFDNDGSLLNAFLGDGAGNTVLGLAGPITVSSGPLVNQIAESQAIFNGKFINGIDTPSDPETSVDAFKGTIIHEIGHGFGLDHAQINVEAIKPGASQEIKESVPLEFPVAVNDLFTIRRDDASSISLLYPNLSELTKFGKIEGKLLRADGVTPVQGGNVIARNINNPTLETISCVSDYLTEGTGTYTLFALPPGDYRIEIEPIDLSFTGGSGVGPFTTNKTDKSFQNPVPKGFYTGSNQPISTDVNQALIVSVASGQTVSDVNIIASTVGSSSSTSSSSGSPSSIQEEEPNDTVNQAQLISIPTTISGNSSDTDDGEVELSSDTGAMIIISDLFKFTLTSSASINALLTIESDLSSNDLDLVLLDGSASDIVETSSQAGNVDELISTSLKAGTYLLGVGAFSGSTSYTLEITSIPSGPEGTPVLTLQAPEALILKPTGMNKVFVNAEASDFSTKSKCTVFTSSDSGLSLKIRPKKFSLSSTKINKDFKIMVNNIDALELINSETSEVVTISVTCDNGASDEIDILLAPNIDNVTESRVYRKVLKK